MHSYNVVLYVAKKIFEKGYRWKVGDGRHIEISKDAWMNIQDIWVRNSASQLLS